MKLQAAEHLLVGRFLRPVLHVGNPLDGQRVGTQINRRIVLVEPPGLLQPLEKIAHGAHVEPGLGQRLKTDPVGFTLEIAGVRELCLNHRRLRRGDGRRRHRGIGPCCQNADGQGDQRRQGILLFLGDLPRQMVLRDVGDFVRNDAGKLRFRLRHHDRAGIDADKAAEHGKGIDRIVADGKKIEIAGRIGARLDQTPPQLGEVIVDFRIIDVARFTLANFLHDRLTDATFELRRKIGPRRLAQIGQIIGTGNGTGKDQRQSKGEGAQIPQVRKRIEFHDIKPMQAKQGNDTGEWQPVRQFSRHQLSRTLKPRRVFVQTGEAAWLSPTTNHQPLSTVFHSKGEAPAPAG